MALSLTVWIEVMVRLPRKLLDPGYIPDFHSLYNSSMLRDSDGVGDIFGQT